MVIKKSFEIPLYKGRFIVMFADSEVKISDHYDDLSEGFMLEYAHCFHVNEEFEGDKYQGFLIAFNTNHEFSEITNGVLFHEVLHATSSVLSNRGMALTNESEEAFTYLAEWMADIVYKIVDENKINISLNR